MPGIRVRDLRKEYRRLLPRTGALHGLQDLLRPNYDIIPAVDNVSFEVEPGEFVGYLGPNGAGKSTTVKMLSGILVPTSGDIQVDGLVPWRDRRRMAQRIGVVFGQRSQLWWDLPLRDSFRLVAALYEVESRDLVRRLGEFTELLELQDFLDTPVRQLSLGQRMRGDLVASMLYEPPLLFLDEPTVGLDVLAKERIREFIADANVRRGTTVILTTHDLVDVELLCTRIVLIDHGRVLYDGEVESLKSKYAPHRLLTVTLDGQSSTEAVARRMQAAQGVDRVATDGNLIMAWFVPNVINAPRAIALVPPECVIVDLALDDPTLEDVVKQIYTDRQPAIVEATG